MKFFQRILIIFMMLFLLTACTTRSNEENTLQVVDEPVAIESEEETYVDPYVLMKNVHARKAISLAIDKGSFIHMAGYDDFITADYLVPKNFVFDKGTDYRAFNQEGWMHYNPVLAREYWNMAKEELSFTNAHIHFYSFDGPSIYSISDRIKESIESTLDGMTVELIQRPFSSQRYPKDVPIHMLYEGWGPDYPDPMTFLEMWVTDGDYNTAGFSNEIYDEVVDHIKHSDLANSYVERVLAVQSLERMLIEEEAVIVPLYQRRRFELVKSYVKGIVGHSFGGRVSYKQASTQADDQGRQVLHLATRTDIPSLDTNKATDLFSFEILGNTMEGLFSLGEKEVLEFGVAKSYHKSEDGLNYTFKLRENAVWSNGAPVTAEDFAYSWKRLADPKTQMMYQFMIEIAAFKNYETVMNGDVDPSELGVKPIDDHTLQVTLERPIPYFEKLLTFPSFYPVNQAFAESMGESFGTSADTTLYNGPFIVSDWKDNQDYSMTMNDVFRMVKNEAYWDAQHVVMDEVSYMFSDEIQENIELYKEGKLDKVVVYGDELALLGEDAELVQSLEPVMFYLVLNQYPFNME
ncbi:MULTISPECIES: ABC transporter substrate-binding protein [unclassified Fusibacter]|uniref:ABC transporter substrate-binding protein n=1 Tax=unclassified Fusibacter TaxID=2624464 RepID=UPI001013023B|nr:MULTISPECIES: ABC transporter substrate-binding protein [unclassified Fusibacter]MCK8058940.1 ABC transporter substrate-binding protein [Fusibacter sp. A2]NPE22016.1 hypothetical protein [Fusibacter sp. A1]RXV61581.1 hypothetical protein DWB64_09235 [Fusibacter sp. A1]